MWLGMAMWRGGGELIWAGFVALEISRSISVSFRKEHSGLSIFQGVNVFVIGIPPHNGRRATALFIWS
jgi:hypothetical protein